MSSVEGPACPAVVEARRISLGPGHHPEVPPGVVGVAGGAAFATIAGVQAESSLPQPRHVLVTGETLAGHGRFTAFPVAGRALERALQRFMWSSQRAGRDLRRQAVRPRQAKRRHRGRRERKPAPPPGRHPHDLPEPGRAHRDDHRDVNEHGGQRQHRERPVRDVPVAKEIVRRPEDARLLGQRHLLADEHGGARQ